MAPTAAGIKFVSLRSSGSHARAMHFWIFLLRWPFGPLKQGHTPRCLFSMSPELVEAAFPWLPSRQRASALLCDYQSYMVPYSEYSYSIMWLSLPLDEIGNCIGRCITLGPQIGLFAAREARFGFVLGAVLIWGLGGSQDARM